MAQKQSSVLSAAPTAAPKDKTVPIKESLEKIKGHGTLTIYRMEKSPYFYVRLFEGGKILRKSTKCTERKTAIDFACCRRSNIDHLYRLNFDQGLEPALMSAGCG